MFGPDSDEEPKHFSRFRRTTSELQPGAGLKLLGIAVATVVLIGVLVVRSLQQETSAPRTEAKEVVVYCAHDLPFVEPLIAEFEEQSGIQVTLVADTEASKSLGLTRRIEAERNHPAADLFWNNQLLGTIDLANKGLFEPHTEISERSRFPDQFRDDAGMWTAFGARLRVWIIDNEVPTSQRPRDGELPVDAEFCIADPLFGTTLTHAAVLRSEHGDEAFRSWFESLATQGVRVLPGNSATRDLVANGICKYGWTDTDDYFGAVERGANVRMEPVRTANGKSIAIPNSVAIIKNGPHPKAARQFVAWLLSESVERKLALGPASQVPVGATESLEPLSDRVDKLRPLIDNAVDLRPLVDDRAAVLEYLSNR